MIILGWTSSFLTSAGDGRPSLSPVRPGAVARLAHLLFCKRVGVAGTIGRIALLVVGAFFSYFVGSGLGELMLKAPVPMVLMFGAVMVALASGDRDPG